MIPPEANVIRIALTSPVHPLSVVPRHSKGSRDARLSYKVAPLIFMRLMDHLIAHQETLDVLSPAHLCRLKLDLARDSKCEDSSLLNLSEWLLLKTYGRKRQLPIWQSIRLRLLVETYEYRFGGRYADV